MLREERTKNKGVFRCNRAILWNALPIHPAKLYNDMKFGNDMKRISGKRKLAVLAAVAGFGVAVPSVAQAPGLAALKDIRPGQWEIRSHTKGDPARKICLRNPAQLLMLQHRGAKCSKPYVIQNDAIQATVSYSCPGKGNGRTTLRVENSELLQLNTQGIAGNAPFAISAEARRIGSC